MNKVHLIGNLTKNVELRYTKNQIAVASYTIAVNSGYGEFQADSEKAVPDAQLARLSARKAALGCSRMKRDFLDLLLTEICAFIAVYVGRHAQ